MTLPTYAAAVTLTQRGSATELEKFIARWQVIGPDTDDWRRDLEAVLAEARRPVDGPCRHSVHKVGAISHLFRDGRDMGVATIGERELAARVAELEAQLACRGDCMAGRLWECCSAIDPSGKWTCTQRPGHAGPHVACAPTHNLATWPNESTNQNQTK